MSPRYVGSNRDAGVEELSDRLGAELFRRVAGPDGAGTASASTCTPGPRWFPAGSPIARVHGDAAMFVGGIRAVLLQTMHPAAMTAVAEHSGYRGDMWGRLARTSRFLAVTTFGTDEDAQQAVDAVRADPRTGQRHAARRDAVRRRRPAPAAVGARRRGRQLPARAPGLRPAPARPGGRRRLRRADGASRASSASSDPPTTEAELAAAIAEFRPELPAPTDAREAVSFLVWHPPLPWAARPVGALVAAAIGLMPVWTRRPLRLPSLPVSERTVVRALGSAATGTIRWAMRPPQRAGRRQRVAEGLRQ